MKKGDKVDLIVTNKQRIEGSCTAGKVYHAWVEEVGGWHGLNFFTFISDNGHEMTVRETHMRFA